MSARTAAAVDRFVTFARQVVANPGIRSAVVTDLCEQLLAAVDNGDMYAAKGLVLDIDTALRG